MKEQTKGWTVEMARRYYAITPPGKTPVVYETAAQVLIDRLEATELALADRKAELAELEMYHQADLQMITSLRQSVYDKVTALTEAHSKLQWVNDILLTNSLWMAANSVEAFLARTDPTKIKKDEQEE